MTDRFMMFRTSKGRCLPCGGGIAWWEKEYLDSEEERRWQSLF